LCLGFPIRRYSDVFIGSAASQTKVALKSNPTMIGSPSEQEFTRHLIFIIMKHIFQYDLVLFLWLKVQAATDRSMCRWCMIELRTPESRLRPYFLS